MIRETATSGAGALPLNRPTRRDPAAAPGRDRWFRSPILWLGVFLFAASIAGCVLTIALALRHADTPLAVDGGQVLKVPAAPAPASGAAGPASRP